MGAADAIVRARAGRGGTPALSALGYTENTLRCDSMWSSEYSLPVPLPGQIEQVYAQSSGDLMFESQNGQVRH